MDAVAYVCSKHDDHRTESAVSDLRPDVVVLYIRTSVGSSGCPSGTHPGLRGSVLEVVDSTLYPEWGDVEAGVYRNSIVMCTLHPHRRIGRCVSGPVNSWEHDEYK